MRLEPGHPAPQFSGLDQDGNSITSTDFADRRVVIYFYPNAFTPGCTTEACDFRDRYQLFQDAGYTIVGVSPNEPEELARFLGIDPSLRTAFMERHADLFETDFWVGIQRRLEAGETIDIRPYKRSRALDVR